MTTRPANRFKTLSVWLSAALLAPQLAGCAAAPDRAAQAGFDYPRKQIVLAATVGDGVEKLFMLDSAVEPSVIDEAVALQYGFVSASGEEKEAEGAGEGDGLTIKEARISGMSIDGVGFAPFDAVAADLTGFGAKLDIDLAGILGHSFLQGRVTRIDYAQRRVEIADSLAALSPIPDLDSQRYSAPLIFMSAEDNIPVVDIEIDGETLRMSLDTGSSLGVQLYESAVARLGLEAEREAGASASVTGARGGADIKKGTIDAVRLGPFIVTDAPAAFSNRAHDPAQRVGNLGNAFLENFVLTLDYANGRIIFEKRKS